MVLAIAVMIWGRTKKEAEERLNCWNKVAEEYGLKVNIVKKSL